MIPERLARFRQQSAAKSTNGEEPTASFLIDGRENPELFLPTELMAYLLSSFSDEGSSRETLRASYEPSLASFGWEPRSFWADLERSAGDYFALTAQNDGAHRSKERSRRICTVRAAALDKMRSKYPRFDEFLYRVEAPRNVAASDQILSADWLLWVEGGCR